MIDYNTALCLALSRWSEFDYCMEYSNTYVFSKHGELSFGGWGSPVVVLKDSGRCVNMVYFTDMPGKHTLIREGFIKGWT